MADRAEEPRRVAFVFEGGGARGIAHLGALAEVWPHIQPDALVGTSAGGLVATMLMQIGQAAAKAGVSVKAIRHWEEEGLLPPVPRRGRYRSLDEGHVARLRVIAHCRKLGFSIGDVREIIELLPAVGCPDPNEMRKLVAARQAAVRREIAHLEAVSQRLQEVDAYLQSRTA